MAAVAAAFFFLILAFSHASERFSEVDVHDLYHGGSSSRSDASAAAPKFVATLTHRDSQGSPYRRADATVQGLLLDRLRRDEVRVKSIATMVTMATNEHDLFSEEDIAATLRSGAAEGSGEYFVTLGVGTPPKTVDLIADTGTDVSWIQCLPCKSCFNQSVPIFDPSASSSFSSVTCSNPLCSKLSFGDCKDKKCLYEVGYGDGSFTKGNLSTETLFFGKDSVPNVAIGCGHNNQGNFTGSVGLLGLGRGPLSFPSQAGHLYGDVFSYCLPSRESNGSVPLVFGEAAVPNNTEFTALEANPKLHTLYYVSMVGIRVGGKYLNIPTGALSLNKTSGLGGVIIDSGTAVTRLVPSVYTPLRDAFRSGMPQEVNMTAAGTAGISLFDTCYNLSGHSSIKLPTVAMLFDGGASMSLPAQNTMVPVDDAGTYCFAFAPNTPEMSIIGNIQQQSFRVSFDVRNSKVGFGANQCS